jgi:hypothetical protein
MMAEDRRTGTAFERHAQTGLTLVLVGLLMWIGSTTQKTQIKLAELSIEVQNLKHVIRAPQARVNDLTRRIEIIEEHVLGKRRPDV